MSKKRAYVPTVAGLILAYRLESLTDPARELGKISETSTVEEKANVEKDRRENLRLRQENLAPLACQSTGRTMVQPLVTLENAAEEFVVWPTELGYLNIAHVNLQAEERLSIRYRLKADEGITSQLSYLPPKPDDLERVGNHLRGLSRRFRTRHP